MYTLTHAHTHKHSHTPNKYTHVITHTLLQNSNLLEYIDKFNPNVDIKLNLSFQAKCSTALMLTKSAM